MNQKIENRGDFLLQKWLDGTITWQEERELEQLAKGDAMLADAFEGFRSMPESNPIQHIENLKVRLQKQTKRKRGGLILYLPRVAAAAAIIGALAFGIWYFSGNVSQKAAIAQQETSREQQAASSEETKDEPPTAINKEQNALALEDQSEKPELRSQKMPAPSVPAPGNTRIKPLLDTNLTIAEAESPAIAAEEKPVEMQMERAKVMNETPQLQKPNAARSLAPNAVLIERIIIGKLTNTKGEPLIGVVVSVDGKDSGTITGLDGDFELRIPAETKELSFSQLGFQKTTVPIGQNDTVTVQLKESGVALSEVVVSGYSTQKQKAEARKEDSEAIKKAETRQGKAQGVQPQSAPQPQPSVGLEKYKQYIEKNLRYPKAAREAGIEGEVAVAFQILPNGELTEFKILKSLGYGCDEEAIRLLKQGPKWERSDPLRGKENMAYLIEFKLKK